MTDDNVIMTSLALVKNSLWPVQMHISEYFRKFWVKMVLALGELQSVGVYADATDKQGDPVYRY